MQKFRELAEWNPVNDISRFCRASLGGFSHSTYNRAQDPEQDVTLLRRRFPQSRAASTSNV